MSVMKDKFLPAMLDLCQKFLFHVACLSMLVWYSWKSVSNHLGKPTSTTLLMEDVSDKGNLPEVLVCREPSFNVKSLRRHNFSGLISYAMGHGVNGWVGNDTTMSSRQVYEDVVSLRSAGAAVTRADISYTVLKNKTSVSHDFNVDTDFQDQVVGYNSKSKCFSLYPRPPGGLERPKGIVFVTFVTEPRVKEHTLELVYPGQYHYHMTHHESRGDRIVLSPDKYKTYTVLLALKRLLPDDPNADCAEYGGTAVPFRTYDDCIMSITRGFAVANFGCVPPLFARDAERHRSSDKMCSDYIAGWLNLMSILGKERSTFCKAPCTTLQVSIRHLTEAPTEGLLDPMVLLEIFPEIQVTQSQFSTTPITVMADLGGYLGLWLGASVLDLTHLITYLIGRK